MGMLIMLAVIFGLLFIYAIFEAFADKKRVKQGKPSRYPESRVYIVHQISWSGRRHRR